MNQLDIFLQVHDWSFTIFGHGKNCSPVFTLISNGVALGDDELGIINRLWESESLCCSDSTSKRINPNQVTLASHNIERSIASSLLNDHSAHRLSDETRPEGLSS